MLRITVVLPEIVILHYLYAKSLTFHFSLCTLLGTWGLCTLLSRIGLEYGSWTVRRVSPARTTDYIKKPAGKALPYMFPWTTSVSQAPWVLSDGWPLWPWRNGWWEGVHSWHLAWAITWWRGVTFGENLQSPVLNMVHLKGPRDIPNDSVNKTGY